MKNSAILATYSLRRDGQENMSKAGLMYDDGTDHGKERSRDYCDEMDMNAGNSNIMQKHH